MFQDIPLANPVADGSRDLCEVAQTGYVDLRLAFSTGTIDGDLSANEQSFNGIDEPNSLIGKPDDCFAAMRAAEVSNSVAAAKSKGGAKTSATAATDIGVSPDE